MIDKKRMEIDVMGWSSNILQPLNTTSNFMYSLFFLKYVSIAGIFFGLFKMKHHVLVTRDNSGLWKRIKINLRLFTRLGHAVVRVLMVHVKVMIMK